MNLEFGITNPQIDEYLLKLAPSQDEVLREMERLAEERGFPIVGPLVGRLLYLLTRLVRARRVLELGSGFGYSAYWFARALPRGGRVFCTESSRENIGLAEEFFRKAGLRRKITYRMGNALEVVKSLSGKFDIVFNDIDKEQYPEAFKLAAPKVRRGGLFISDNILWGGRVLGDSGLDPPTRGVKEFTRLLLGSKEFFTVILPLRDGVSVSLKL